MIHRTLPFQLHLTAELEQRQEAKAETCAVHPPVGKTPVSILLSWVHRQLRRCFLLGEPPWLADIAKASLSPGWRHLKPANQLQVQIFTQIPSIRINTNRNITMTRLCKGNIEQIRCWSTNKLQCLSSNRYCIKIQNLTYILDTNYKIPAPKPLLDCPSEGTDRKGYRENNRFIWRTIIQKRIPALKKYCTIYRTQNFNRSTEGFQFSF